MMNSGWKIQLASLPADEIPAGLWGLNFEITRSTMFGGLSAQMINNRKFFAGSSDEFARGWKPIGACRMSETGKSHLPLLALSDQASGVTQESNMLKMRPQTEYCWRLCLKGSFRAKVLIRLGTTEVCSFCSAAGERIIIEGSLFSTAPDCDRIFTILATGQGEMVLENVSLMPSDAILCGLRADVISQLRALHPHSLRFPGGCYAEFYDWKQGLKEPDDRGVISVKGMDFLLGHTMDQDPQDMSLDDFVAVCRLVGARPEYTVRITDSSAEDAAALVEYANGSAKTHWGSVRASRGHTEPYHIRRWYIGNEIKAFVRGMDDPIAAAKQTVLLAKAMKEVDPDIELVPSNWWPCEWNAVFMAEIERLGGTELLARASHHQYLLDIMSTWGIAPIEPDPLPMERVEACLRSPVDLFVPLLHQVREELNTAGPKSGALPITMDEWNYRWGRAGHPVLALCVAGIFNVLIRHAAEIDIREALFFHPINEGILRVTPDGVTQEDGAHAWHLSRGHIGKRVLPILNPQPDHPVDVAASMDANSRYITLVNRSLGKEGRVIIPGLSGTKAIRTECWKLASLDDCFRAGSMQPHSLIPDDSGELILPPASMAGIWIQGGENT